MTRPIQTTAETRELFHVCMVLQGRIDSIWERLVYTHAAIATVMAFLSENFNPDASYYVTRSVVFAFYTVNLLIALAAMWESYRGLQAGLADLRVAHVGEGLSHMDRWMLKLDYRSHPWRRVAMLGVVWLVLGYLLFEPLCGVDFGTEWGICAENRQEAEEFFDALRKAEEKAAAPGTVPATPAPAIPAPAGETPPAAAPADQG